MSKTVIKTAGELRDTLAKALVAVRDGDLELDNARAIVKLAAQINESFYSELKAHQVRMEGGEKAIALGALPIT